MRKKYGAVYSMRVGSFTLVVAEDADSVKEVLVKKSADYAGRPPFHSLALSSLGMCCEQLGKYKTLACTKRNTCSYWFTVLAFSFFKLYS